MTALLGDKRKVTMTYDLVIVGAGPAGLSAAINGASEGLRVALLDSAEQLGGQARASSCVENYPLPFGAQNGVSGKDLMLGFAAQAEKFCAQITVPAEAARLVVDGSDRVIVTKTFEEYRARAVILSMGLQYRRLEADGISRFMGRGVYYGVPGAGSYSGRSVAVIGGANSAGQAVVRLAQSGAKVMLISRGKIADQMSAYLVTRILAMPNVEVLEGAAVKRVGGTTQLERAQIIQDTNVIERDVDEMFIFIGAVPYTAWLPDTIKMSDRRFVMTDSDVQGSFPDGRILPCETSIPGVFASGDIRHGQGVKRITGAVFDGVCAIQSTHKYLAGGR